MKNLRGSYLGILAVVSVTVGGSAIADDVRQLSAGTNVTAVSVDELVREALARNPENRFYQAEIEAAKAGRKTAGAWPNPELNGSVGQKSVRDGGLNAEGVAWSASVMQPFEWPGRIGLRKAIANRDIELAELGYCQFQVALAGRVRLLAYGLRAAQDKANAAQEVAQRFRELREVLVQRDPAGLTPLLETRVIESSELTFQRKATEADLAREAARLELNQLRGADPAAALRIGEGDLVLKPAASQETLLRSARTNNFEIRLRAAELAQQGFKVELAKNERFPSLSVGPSVSEERAGDRERIIGVGISVPIPLWNRNEGNIRVAEARRVQAETSMVVKQREIERKVVDASIRYDRKLAEMAKWRPDATAHLREAAEVADRHYRLGAVPVSTYVELQEKYLEAVEGLLDTKREALEAGEELELLAGTSEPLSTIAAGKEKK